jgi:hypothetical protein
MSARCLSGLPARPEQRGHAVPGYTERATMPTPKATYCHACAAARHLLYPLPADPLTTAYQLGSTPSRR